MATKAKKGKYDKPEESKFKSAAQLEEIRARCIGNIVQCMKRFFAGKAYYKPYPDPKDASVMLTEIPQETLISPTNINIILTSEDYNEAMEFAQEAVAALRSRGVALHFSGPPTEEKETELYLRVTREFRQLEIPYHYQGGMLLLYLWLCEGVEFK